MSQDATKVALGGAGSNVRDIESFNDDPANFPAGSVVSLASTGLLSLESADGMRIGVSRGKSLADHEKTAVQRAGLRVPVLAHSKRASGTVTITNIANLVNGTDDTVTVGATAFTATDGAVTPGQATFDARTGTSEAATSLAAQINAHATANALVYAVASAAVVTIYAIAEGAAGNETVALTYEQLGTGDGATIGGEVVADELGGGSDTASDIDYIVVGAKMYVNAVSGKADAASFGSAVSDAVYVSGPLTGIAEDGTEVAAVIVDMQGGL